MYNTYSQILRCKMKFWITLQFIIASKNYKDFLELFVHNLFEINEKTTPIFCLSFITLTIFAIMIVLPTFYSKFCVTAFVILNRSIQKNGKVYYLKFNQTQNITFIPSSTSTAPLMGTLAMNTVSWMTLYWQTNRGLQLMVW